MRTQRDYDAAVAQLKTSIADLTDDHIAIFRDRDPAFADRVALARDRHRAGEAYQAKVARESGEREYARDVERGFRRLNHQQQESRFSGMGEPQPTSARRGVVVRLDPKDRR